MSKQVNPRGKTSRCNRNKKNEMWKGKKQEKKGK